jgi:hypothetical protein
LYISILNLKLNKLNIMTAAIFKKSPQERHDSKLVTKSWLKDLKKINPTITKKTALAGFKTNQFTKIKEILDLAEAAKIAMAK